MKRFLLPLYASFLFCLFCWLPGVYGQSTAYLNDAQTVLERYVEASGGLDVFDDLQTLRVRGVYSRNGTEVGEIMIVQKRPNLRRLWIKMEDYDVEIVHDGQIVWRRIVAKEEQRYALVTGAEKQFFIDQSPLEGFWLRAFREGLPVQLLGREAVGNHLCYVLEYVGKERIFRGFIDVRGFFNVKQEIFDVTGAGPHLRTEIEYTNYEERHGLLLPMKLSFYDVQNDLRSSFQLEKVDTNIGVFDSYFNLPQYAREGMQRDGLWTE